MLWSDSRPRVGWRRRLAERVWVGGTDRSIRAHSFCGTFEQSQFASKTEKERAKQKSKVVWTAARPCLCELPDHRLEGLGDRL